MKKLALVPFILLANSAMASDFAHYDDNFLNGVGLSASVWNSTGSAKYSIDSSKGSPMYGNPTSILDYETDMQILDLSYKWGVDSFGHFFEATISKSLNSDTGIITDSDFYSPSHAAFLGGPEMFSQTTSQVKEADAFGIKLKIGQIIEDTMFFDDARWYTAFSYWKEEYKAYGVHYTADPYGPNTGVTVFDYDTYALGYETSFYNYELGADWDLALSNQLTATINTGFMLSAHKGTDTHPLRADLAKPSVEFRGMGYGYNLGLNLNYDVSDNLAVYGYYKYGLMKTFKGNATFHFSDGSSGTSDLVEASIERQGVGVGITYIF